MGLVKPTSETRGNPLHPDENLQALKNEGDTAYGLRLLQTVSMPLHIRQTLADLRAKRRHEMVRVLCKIVQMTSARR